MTPTRIRDLGSDLRRMRRRVASTFQSEPTRAPERPRQRPRKRDPVPVSLSIADVMERNLATVLPGSPLRFAVRLMIEHRISSVPVVDVEGRIVGALNEGDLMQVFHQPGVHCVADVMTQEPIVLPIDAPFIDVIDQLMSSNFRRVLIHEHGMLVGVITRSHVMPALLAALEHRVSEDASH